MTERPKAIDIMYYVATPEFIAKWTDAKKGEAGVEKVFITQTKMWSYWNKWMYMDTSIEEVTQYTEKYPGRFVGLAGYNPFRIKESLAEIQLAVTKHGFK